MEDIFFSGEWARFSGYEIQGAYIRPVSGSTLERYHPLDEFQNSRANRSESHPPYRTLLGLVDQLAFDADGRLTSPSLKSIANWCGENGVLGILPHQVQQVRFAPYWRRALERKLGVQEREELSQLRESLLRSGDSKLVRVGKALTGSKPNRLMYTQRIYRRSAWGSYFLGESQIGTAPRESNIRKNGKMVSADLWKVSPPGALVQNMSTGEWEWESLDATWARYFPSIPKHQRIKYQYPPPYSDGFWELYAEPVSDFIATARQFREAFLAAAKMKPNSDFGNDDGIKPTISKLNALVAPVGPALVRMSDGSLEQRSISPSLLGALAIMAQQDLASDRRVIRCQNEGCRLIVVAVKYQTKYCSQQCRFVDEKRRQRKAKRLNDEIAEHKATGKHQGKKR